MTSYLLSHNQQTIPVTIVYSQRKTMVICVSRERSVILRCPARTKWSIIQDFIEKKAPWIVKHTLSNALSFISSKPSYEDGSTHFFLGTSRTLMSQKGLQNKVEGEGKDFLITYSGFYNQEKIKTMVHQWYKAQANIYFLHFFHQHWPFFAARGYRPPTISLKFLRSRWGSLSSKGGLTLNVELVQFPLACIEYVVVHELCHLMHFNHSSAFWSAVQRILPDYKKAHEILRKRGMGDEKK
jgi:predicted metal-dependent hydrolase